MKEAHPGVVLLVVILMARQTPSPKQLLTIRQAIIVIGIIALAYFAFRYGQNVLAYRELQSELGEMDSQISRVDAEKDAINREFDDSLSPAVVEDFARGEMNWVRSGDEVIITLGDDQALPANDSGSTSGSGDSEEEGDDVSSNVQLWLKLIRK